MHVEVDQSGKIGTKGPTALAFSNDIDWKILIPARVKRECIWILRAQGMTGKTFYLQLFSVALFLLLKDHIDQLMLVTIDPEYKSKDEDIKRFLLNLFRRANMRVSPDKIRFQRIGKKSPAHQKALATFRGTLKPDKIVDPEDLLEQLVVIDQ
jgi:hypothetical protein